MRIDGLHHVTCITGDAPRTVDFCARVLGLRLAKRTVNQDDPTVWHLFFTDEAGTPGSDLTFFEYPGARRGAVGAGMVHRIRYRVPSVASVDYWEARLRDERALAVTRMSDGRLRFAAPEGLGMELAVVDVPDAPLVARSTQVPEEHALQGFDGVDALVGTLGPSEAVLSTVLAFERRSDSAGAGEQASTSSWEARGDTRGGTITLETTARRGASGAGTVHHVAWTVRDDEELLAWQHRAVVAGERPTPAIDRFWFHSVYFREPGGILHELATVEPGFTADETLETLGTELVLPPRFEPARAQIEPALTPLPDVSAWRSAPTR